MSSKKLENKGKKRVKNQPILHDEVKKSRHIFLTPSSWEKMRIYAFDQGISISELIEQWARKIEGD